MVQLKAVDYLGRDLVARLLLFLLGLRIGAFGDRRQWPFHRAVPRITSVPVLPMHVFRNFFVNVLLVRRGRYWPRAGLLVSRFGLVKAAPADRNSVTWSCRKAADEPRMTGRKGTGKWRGQWSFQVSESCDPVSPGWPIRLLRKNSNLLLKCLFFGGGGGGGAPYLNVFVYTCQPSSPAAPSSNPKQCDQMLKLKVAEFFN